MNYKSHIPTNNMNQPVLVVAAIIRKNGKLLIAQRKNDSKREPNKWEFPGGKVEFGEHPEDAIIREIKEELNIKIKVNTFFSVSSHMYERDGKPSHVILLTFLTTYLSGKLEHLDVQDSKWIYPHQFSKFQFVAGDKKIINKLKKKSKS